MTAAGVQLAARGGQCRRRIGIGGAFLSAKTSGHGGDLEETFVTHGAAGRGRGGGRRRRRRS
jgi:hypothetical protein